MFKISLRAARITSGYTVDKAAKYCGISVPELNGIEVNSEEIPFSLMEKLIILYKAPLDLIYFGSESDLYQT